MIRKKTAIILGSNVNGLGVIRSLGRLGVDCMAVYAETAGDFALYSRYLKRSRQRKINFPQWLLSIAGARSFA